MSIKQSIIIGVAIIGFVSGYFLLKERSNLVEQEASHQRLADQSHSDFNIDEIAKSISQIKDLDQTLERSLEEESESIDRHIDNQNYSRLSQDRSWWFSPPQLSSETTFEAAQTLVTLDSSCQSINSPVNPQWSLEKNFKQTHGLATEQRFPEDLFYFSLTQFWSLGQDYFQFIAVWDKDMPARYRYEFYQSTDINFEERVNPIDLPLTMPPTKDVIATNQFVSHLSEFYLSQGAKLGARILVGSINDPVTDQQVTLVNSQLIRWSTAQFQCESDGDFSKSICHCNAGEKA